MPSSITSPGCSQTGGLKPMPTPGGVPVLIRSPGSRTRNWRHVVHEEVRVEDHRRGGAGLPAYAVDVQPHVQGQHVVDLVRGDQPRPGGVERLGRLALDPLAAALDLEGALADVVDHEEAGDRVARLLHRVEVAGAAADHDAELHLPVGLGGAAGDAHVVVRADERVRRLGEQDRLGRAPPGRFRRRGRGSSGRCTGSGAGARSARRCARRRTCDTWPAAARSATTGPDAVEAADHRRTPRRSRSTYRTGRRRSRRRSGRRASRRRRAPMRIRYMVSSKRRVVYWANATQRMWRAGGWVLVRRIAALALRPGTSCPLFGANST